jgi:hypothetical protein
MPQSGSNRVQVLQEGLVENTPKGVRADYDAIETRIAL